MAYESVVGTAAAGATFARGIRAYSFAVRHWRLVSEGAALAEDRCGKDGVAGAPVLAFCSAIDADQDHDCAPFDFPSAPHCSAFWRTLDIRYGDWFDGL